MLITLLQENARAPLKLLASKVFLSAPAVSSRIDKLEKQGIILGYNTVIDRQKLGYHITAFINLELAAARKSEFYPFINSCPNVLECNCITGVYSMLIKVAFPSTQELDTFIGKIQRFRNTSTQIVFPRLFRIAKLLQNQMYKKQGLQACSCCRSHSIILLLRLSL